MERRWLGVGALAIGVVACTADSRGTDQRTASSRSALSAVPPVAQPTQRIAWGEAPGQLGFRPAFREAMPMGVPAVAAAPGGAVLVLDALRERVVRVQKGDVAEVAKVPQDADDLAVSADGAFAVRRSVRPEVLVFSATGERIGSVDISAVEDVDAITLAGSRRVVVTNGFQQSFLVGSPSMPQTKASIQANVRDGAAFMPDGSGVVAAKNGDVVELRVLAQTDERTQIKAHWPLGNADAARLIGVDGVIGCARLERVGSDQAGAGAIIVKREAVCVDLRDGTAVFRRELPPPGAYLPRRELALSGGNLVLARPTGDGLDVTTWAIGGAR
jgi:hypothetical protein